MRGCYQNKYTSAYQVAISIIIWRTSTKVALAKFVIKLNGEGSCARNLLEIDAAKKNAAKQSGISEAEEAVSDAYERQINLENKLLAMVPTSPADAAALLRLSRFVIEDDRDDGLDLSLAAIERVAEYFEGRGAA